MAAMNGADAIVFTGGIGENSAEIRSGICSDLEWMGVEVDAERNASLSRGKEGVFSRDSSRVKLMVLPTNEELMIAIDTATIVAH